MTIYSKSASEFVNSTIKKLSKAFIGVDEIAQFNQEKVLEAFNHHQISLNHLQGSTGYGYGDTGRDKLYELFATIFGGEKAIISPQIMSGTHAIGLALYGVLRPNDLALSITGKPYDTLVDVISGASGSLKDFLIDFNEINLLENNDFDYDQIEKILKTSKVKMVYIQRSRGYQWRDALSIDEIAKVVDFVKNIAPDTIVMIDNCYCEFVEKREPLNVGADLIAGSMIKNPGAGIASTGGYICGKSHLIDLVAGRFTMPSVGAEIGSYILGYKEFYQGLFLAPHTVAQSVKGSLLLGDIMTKLGYETLPRVEKKCTDITRAIKFGNEQALTSFLQSIQETSPIDSHLHLEAWEMPGYDAKVIMAAGCFVQGASLELSGDAPIKPPYIAYVQGGLTFEHCVFSAKVAVTKLFGRQQ